MLDVDRLSASGLHLRDLRNHLVTEVLLRFSLFRRHIFLVERAWLCLHAIVDKRLFVNHGLVAVIICVLQFLTEIGHLILV